MFSRTDYVFFIQHFVWIYYFLHLRGKLCVIYVYLFLNCLLMSSNVLFVTSRRIFSLNKPAFWALFFKFALLIGNFPDSIFEELLRQPSQLCIWCYDFALSDSKFHFFSEKQMSLVTNVSWFLDFFTQFHGYCLWSLGIYFGKLYNLH